MPTAIALHPRRELIELCLAARVPTRFLASRFGVSKSAASRHKINLERDERHYMVALRKALRTHGHSKQTLMRDYANV